MALAAGGDVMQLQVSKRLAIHVAPLSLTPLHTLRIFVLRSVGLAAPHAPRRVAPLSSRSHHLFPCYRLRVVVSRGGMVTGRRCPVETLFWCLFVCYAVNLAEITGA